MKLCPKCSTKNRDSARFCEKCGESIENVSIAQEDYLADISRSLTKAGELLSAGVNQAKSGVNQATKRILDEREKFQENRSAGVGVSSFVPQSVPVQAASKPYYEEHYPFFEEDNERTLAVIGAESVKADLDGAYQKPYAVLSEQRLYCKNEFGNFSMNVSEIISAKEAKGTSCTWALYVATVVSIMFAFGYLIAINKGIVSVGTIFIFLIIICFVSALAAIYFHKKSNLKMTTIFLLICSCLHPIICGLFALIYLVPAWKSEKKPKLYVITCMSGTFNFLQQDYSQQELWNFSNQVARITYRPEGQVGTKQPGISYQPHMPYGPQSEKKGSPIVTIAAVLVITAIIAGAAMLLFSTLTTCKVKNCENEVFRSGYCKRHYYEYEAKNAVDGLFDGWFN